jgi:putative SOS response-associated peptidase YedK
MCNDYQLKVDVASIVEDFADLKIKIRFGEWAPIIEARDDIKITDMGPIIRTVDGARGEGDLVHPDAQFPAPWDLVDADSEALRACGFSGAKITTIRRSRRAHYRDWFRRARSR